MFSGQRLPALVALFSMLACPAFADEIFSLKAGYITLDPEGEVAVSTSGLAGTRLDIDDELGFDDDADYFVEAALQLGSFRLFAAYLPLSFSGASVLTENINFNGETFVVGSRVDSEVDLDIYEAGIAWYLVNVDDAPVRVQIGPELAVKYVDVHVEMQASDAGLNESEGIGVPVPTLGARARVAVGDYLGVVGRVGYMEYDDNSFLDVDAQVEFSPLPMVGLFAGYRHMDIDVDENDLFIDASFAGPYAGAMVRF